jgi:ankyrin repeat protein
LDNGEADSGRRSREVVLFEEESTMEWYQAIERKDCKMLMSLLGQDEGSTLLLKTGKAGRTALHVAAIQGSLELVHIIRGFFPDVNVNAQRAQTLTVAIDGRCGMNAVDIASKIVGYSCDDMILGGRDCSTFTPFLALSADFWQSEYKLTRERVDGVEKVILSVLQGHYEGLTASFKQNVDYNFCSSEDEYPYEYLFLFHHACSRVDSQKFVKDVIRHCLDVSIEQLNELMQLRDFQGRTPLHVAVAVAPAKGRDHVLENLLRSLKFYDYEELVYKFVGVRDGRGWTPLHLAATQPYSDAIGKLISCADIEIIKARISGNYGINPDRLEEFGKNPYCTAIHLAVLHSNPEIVDQLLQASREVRDYFDHFTLERKINCEFLPNKMFGHWTVLSLALLLGDDDVLEALLPAVDKAMVEVRTFSQ